MPTFANHHAIYLTTSPRRILDRDLQRIGLILQNQEAAANIFVRSGGDGAARSYLKLATLGDYAENILPPQQELWAYSDIAGAILTVVNKYAGD